MLTTLEVYLAEDVKIQTIMDKLRINFKISDKVMAQKCFADF